MRHKIGRLIQHCNRKLQQNHNILISYEREIRAINKSIIDLKSRVLTLKQLCVNLCDSGRFNRTELLSLQRRRAIILRKITEIEMMLSQKKRESEIYEIRKGEAMNARKEWLNKMDKYSRLQSIQSKKLIQFRQEAEEKEIEERVTWQR